MKLKKHKIYIPLKDSYNMVKAGKLKSLLYGIPLILASLSPIKSHAQERLIIDPFSQSNDRNLDYHGSGDVNLDNTVNWEDYALMNSGVQNDMSDINGDGITDNLDKQDLEAFMLTGDKSKVPVLFYDNLSKTEQNILYDRMKEIDKTDTILLSEGCDHFAIPYTINFSYFESLEGVDPEDFKWRFSKNGRFNITPIFYVATTTTKGKRHAINGGALLGDNPFDFYSWRFTEPSDDKDVHSGDWNMANNNYVKVNKLTVNSDGTWTSSPMIMWYLNENGSPTLQYTPKLKYIVKSDPNKDKTAPNAWLSIPDSTFKNPNVSFEYLVKEDQTFLDSCRHSSNGNSWNYIPCEVYATDIVSAPVDSISGEISLILEPGENNFQFYVSDIAGKDTLINRTFVYDTTSNVPDAVDRKTLENYLIVYPNPVLDILRFKGLSEGKVDIYNSSGKKLEKRSLEGNSINLSTYKPGMYFIKTTDSKGKIYTNKIVKQ